MLRRCTLFLGAGFLLLMAACSKNNSKEGSSNNGQLAGNYQFLYLTTAINLTEQASIGGHTAKLVIVSGYKTDQNTGTVVFTADSAIGKDIGYSYDTTTTTTEYDDGVAQTPQIDPFTGTVPPTSSTSKYQVIGTDSVYFPGGVLGAGSAISGSPVPVAPPTGGHFAFKGDTLTIVTNINQTYPDNLGGIPTTATAVVNATIYLLKQK